MQDLSLFDVLGPVMIGPSSSHTAGATRIGWLARQIIGAPPAAITLRFEPGLMHTYKGHGTDAGLVAGLLGHREDDPFIRSALATAKAAGLGPAVEPLAAAGPRNRMECDVLTVNGDRRRVLGVSVGGGNVIIAQIDGIEMHLDGSSGGLLLQHDGTAVDQGVLAELGRRGFWVDAMREGRAVADSDSQGGHCLRGLTFVPGPVAPDQAQMARLVSEHASQGLREARWVPGLRDLRLNPADRQALFVSGADYIRLAQGQAQALPSIAVQYEQGLTGRAAESIRAEARELLEVMREAVKTGLEQPLRLMAGFVPGDDGKRVWARAADGKALVGSRFAQAIARSLAVAEVNASMGKVVAAPTAGSCGVLPGVLLTVAERTGAPDNRIADALLIAAAVGAIVGRVASFSGSVGGCQGEVGIAAGMAAAAAAYLGQGDGDAIFHAAAMAMKNLIGLACDPAAGPVEVPCIKRNVGGVSIALSAAEMALAGVRSAIPFDEVILALKNAQDLLHEDLRDNTLGGLGSTPTAAQLKQRWECMCK